MTEELETGSAQGPERRPIVALSSSKIPGSPPADAAAAVLPPPAAVSLALAAAVTRKGSGRGVVIMPPVCVVFEQWMHDGRVGPCQSDQLP